MSSFLYRVRPSGSSSNPWITVHSCHGSSGMPRSSAAKSMMSKPRDVSGVSSLSGGVHRRGTVRPSTLCSGGSISPSLGELGLSSWRSTVTPSLSCHRSTGLRRGPQSLQGRLKLGAELFEYGIRVGVLHEGVQEPFGDLEVAALVLRLRDQFARVDRHVEGLVDRSGVDLRQPAQACVLGLVVLLQFGQRALYLRQ